MPTQLYFFFQSTVTKSHSPASTIHGFDLKYIPAAPEIKILRMIFEGLAPFKIVLLIHASIESA